MRLGPGPPVRGIPDTAPVLRLRGIAGVRTLAVVVCVSCVNDFVSDPHQPAAVGHSQVRILPEGSALDGVGSSEQLSAEAVDENGFVLTGQTIRWRSLRPAIATVDSASGRVTAVASGQAIIEAVAGSGGFLGYALVNVSVPFSPSLVGLDSVQGLTDEQINAIWGAAPGDVWAVGMLGTLLHFDGTVWTRVAAGLTTRHLWGVWGSAANDVFVVGDAGTVLHFDGSDWAAANVPTTESLRDVWGASPRQVIAVGTDGTILHFDGVWHADTSGVSTTLRGVWGASTTDVWAVGDAGVILHHTSDGWSGEASSSAAVLLDVWGASSGDVVAVGGAGTVLRRSAGTWAVEPTGYTDALTAAWGTSARTLVAVGSDGALLRYAGTEWQRVATSSGHPLQSISGFSTGQVFIGGLDGTLLATTSGAGVRLVFSAVPSQPAAAGVPFSVEVRVVDGQGATLASATDSISVALVDTTGGARLLGNTTVVASGGIAGFVLTLEVARTRHVLTASARGHATAYSPGFAVDPAGPQRLAFVVQPADTRKDSLLSPAPRVAVLDAFGNTVRAFGGSVVVQLGANHSGGSLFPPAQTARTPVNGVATFDSLHVVNRGGNDYTLVATATGLTRANSDTFRVLQQGVPASVAFVPEAITARWGDTLTFNIEIRDGDGNLVPGASAAVATSQIRVVDFFPVARGGQSTSDPVAIGTGQTLISATTEDITGYGTITVGQASTLTLANWVEGQVNTGTLYDVRFIGPLEYVAVGADGAFVTGSVGGSDAAQHVPNVGSLLGVWSAGNSPVWVVSGDGALLRIDDRTNAPGTVTEVARAPGIAFRGIWGGTPTELFLVGDGAQGCEVLSCLYRFDGSNFHGDPPGSHVDARAGTAIWGASRGFVAWSRLQGTGHFGTTALACASGDLHGVWGTAPNDVFMVGSAGTIVHWDGAGCSRMVSPTTADLFDVAGFGPNDVYAVGAGGTILHYDGASWQSVASPTTATLHAVAAFRVGPAVFAGGNVIPFSAGLVAVGDNGTIVNGSP